MKKIFYVLLCMGMLVGCGKSQEEELKELKALDIPKISESEASASFLEKYPDPNEILKYSDQFADSCNTSKESSYQIIKLSSKDDKYIS